MHTAAKDRAESKPTECWAARKNPLFRAPPKTSENKDGFAKGLRRKLLQRLLRESYVSPKQIQQFALQRNTSCFFVH